MIVLFQLRYTGCFVIIISRQPASLHIHSIYFIMLSAEKTATRKTYQLEIFLTLETLRATGNSNAPISAVTCNTRLVIATLFSHSKILATL